MTSTETHQGLVMNRARAEYVRTLRVAQGRTWPALALACVEQWALGAEAYAATGLVELGRSICEASAALFGEDPHSDPWN